MNYGPFEGFCNFEQVLRHRHRHRLRLVIDANVLNKRIIIIITPKSFISAQDAQTTNLAGHRTAGGGPCNGTRSGPNRCNDTCQNIPFCSTFGFTIAKITIRQFFFCSSARLPAHQLFQPRLQMFVISFIFIYFLFFASSSNQLGN